MRTVSYERSVQKQLLYMAREIGSLKGDLHIIRATLAANLEHFADWPCIAECIERIDAALKESQS